MQHALAIPHFALYGNGVIYLSDLNCSTGVTSSLLSGCTYITSTPRDKRNNATHADDLGVICGYGVGQPPATAIRYVMAFRPQEEPLSVATHVALKIAAAANVSSDRVVTGEREYNSELQVVVVPFYFTDAEAHDVPTRGDLDLFIQSISEYGLAVMFGAVSLSYPVTVVPGAPALPSSTAPPTEPRTTNTTSTTDVPTTPQAPTTTLSPPPTTSSANTTEPPQTTLPGGTTTTAAPANESTAAGSSTAASTSAGATTTLPPSTTTAAPTPLTTAAPRFAVYVTVNASATLASVARRVEAVLGLGVGAVGAMAAPDSPTGQRRVELVFSTQAEMDAALREARTAQGQSSMGITGMAPVSGAPPGASPPSNNMQIVYIGAGAGAGVLLVAVIAVVVLRRRKTAPTRYDPEYVQMTSKPVHGEPGVTLTGV